MIAIGVALYLRRRKSCTCTNNNNTTDIPALSIDNSRDNQGQSSKGNKEAETAIDSKSPLEEGPEEQKTRLSNLHRALQDHPLEQSQSQARANQPVLSINP